MNSSRPECFTEDNYQPLCKVLASKDAGLQSILSLHGYPPFWGRPNTFAALVLTILEQQVSLASAYAAFTRLKEKLPVLEPHLFLELTDEELRSCYFTRQKTGYVRGLAHVLLNKELDLASLAYKEDEEVRTILKRLKGIGDWTADIYLIHVLKRTDIFPLGDLALINALKEVKALPATVTREELLRLAEPWRPYRSIATMILWHHYIKKRKIKLLEPGL